MKRSRNGLNREEELLTPFGSKRTRGGEGFLTVRLVVSPEGNMYEFRWPAGRTMYQDFQNRVSHITGVCHPRQQCRWNGKPLERQWENFVEQAPGAYSVVHVLTRPFAGRDDWNLATERRRRDAYRKILEEEEYIPDQIWRNDPDLIEDLAGCGIDINSVAGCPLGIKFFRFPDAEKMILSLGTSSRPNSQQWEHLRASPAIVELYSERGLISSDEDDLIATALQSNLRVADNLLSVGATPKIGEKEFRALTDEMKKLLGLAGAEEFHIGRGEERIPHESIFRCPQN